MWFIRLYNSVFVNNSARMVSVNFIIKYMFMMHQYWFNSYDRISDEFGLTCFAMNYGFR